MAKGIIGIDIAKDKFDAALLVGERCYQREFANTGEGFERMKKWASNHEVGKGHACMEATGSYWEELAAALFKAGYTVSVVNPACVKAFANSELQRSKTDRLDAALIARFCRALKPKPWNPPAPEVRALRGLVRRLDDLKGMLGQERNRLQTPGISPQVKASIEGLVSSLRAEIKAMEQQIEQHIKLHPNLKHQHDLLLSIPGVGRTTAAVLLSEVGDIREFESARQLAASAGLVPSHRQSGSSLRGKSLLSKRGNARLRLAMYMPALVAKGCNPIIRSFYQRLLAAGKSKMVALTAAMRKLLHLIFGILKSQKPFDPNYQPCTT